MHRIASLKRLFLRCKDKGLGKQQQQKQQSDDGIDCVAATAWAVLIVGGRTVIANDVCRSGGCATRGYSQQQKKSGRIDGCNDDDEETPPVSIKAS